MNAKEIIKLIQEQGIQAVDLRFTDLPGLWQHFTANPDEVTEESINEGFGFDGSSIRGFQQIQESDMLLMRIPALASRIPSPRPAP